MARSSRREHLVVRGVLLLPAVISFVLYVLTLGRGVGLADSGELALAVNKHGVPHPPGFPVYMVLGSLAAHLPFGSLADRLNMLSAFAGAAAVAAFALLAFELLRPAQVRSRREEIDRMIVVCAVSVTAMALGVSVLFWSWSIVTEVYAVNVSLLLWAFTCAAYSRRAVGPRRQLLLGAAGLFAGLAVGVHVVTAVFALPALALMGRVQGRMVVRYWPVVAGGFVGLLSYLYLPIAASHHPLLNWGETDTFGRFVRHVTGLSYASNVKLSAGAAAHELGFFISLVFRQFTPVGLGLVVFGALDLWKRKRFAAYAIVAAVVPIFVFGLMWIIPEDKDAYYLPALTLLAIAVAAGLASGGRELFLPHHGQDTAGPPAPSKRLALAAVVALLVVSVSSAAFAVGPARQKARPTATVVAGDALRSVRRNATFIVSSWDVFAPLWYLQNVEGVRRDVRVVGTKLLYWSWYYEMLRRQYPELVRPCSGPISALVSEMRKYESGRPFDKERLFGNLDKAIDGFVQIGSRRGPVYYMPPFEPDTGRGYRLVPRGLADQLVDWKDSPPRPRPPKLRGIPLVRAAPGFGGDALRRLYAQAISDHATYVLAFKDESRAVDLFREALAVDPSFTQADDAMKAAASGKRPTLARPAKAPEPRRPCR